MFLKSFRNSIDTSKLNSKDYKTVAFNEAKMRNTLQYGCKWNSRYVPKSGNKINKYKQYNSNDKIKNKKNKQGKIPFQNQLINTMLKIQEDHSISPIKEKQVKSTAKIQSTIDQNWISIQRIEKYMNFSQPNQHQECQKLGFYLNKMRKMHKKALFQNKQTLNNNYIGLSRYKNQQSSREQKQKIIKNKLFKYCEILKKPNASSNQLGQSRQSLKCISFQPKRRNSVNLNPPIHIQQRRSDSQYYNLRMKIDFTESFKTIDQNEPQPKNIKRQIVKRRCKTINSQRAMISFIQI